MKCDELYQLMANPASLSYDTITDLKQIVNDFPYFHAARMLYLKNLAAIEDIRLNVELKKMVIHLPDASQLFLLLEGERFSSTLKQDLTENEFSSEEPLVFEPTSIATVDYTQMLTDDEPQAQSSSNPKLQHQELIDSFIINEQSRSGSRFKPEIAKNADDSDEIIQESNLTEQPLDNTYFTETLAHIYIKQK
ncbi:MAG: hypothetical protein LBE56_10090, partial [Tannerella sp.]|nr:hypothetical protein [Tannerella sp.]